MNFLKTVNFDQQKIQKIWKYECFLDVSNSTLLLKKVRIKEIILWKLEPLVKVVLLNKNVLHSLFTPNFDIGRLFYSFNFFQYSYYSINTTFHDAHTIKVGSHRQM
jgi:hypothetical protein